MSGEMDIVKIMLDSGWVVKGVLLLLVLSSVMSWAIVLMKKKVLDQTETLNEQFLQMFRSASNLKEAAEQARHLPFSPYKAVFEEGYNEFTRYIGEAGEEKLKSHYENFGLDSIERAMKKGVNQANLKLEEKLSTLASIGSVSPFIGLFGTVWGIIDSFTGLASGGATLDAVAPGIAEALVATAVGLAAAIPAVWFFNVFNNRVGAVNTQVESFENEFLNSVERAIL
ncbi:MAG: MotA/TolQ/ExbB proton channel family protein [Bdellovibrionota bacterium]|jgi:biopolymer transport protein TolQ|nr:MotA/TolQ/ExbB proton channel family protein [Bdellovibrionota bacterium]